jgi:FtsH-binding integral membrane protein
MLRNDILGVLMMVLYVVSILALVCCGLDKRVPINYILLGCVTFCTAWIVATVCQRTKPLIVFEASTLTFAVTLAITVYAFTTKTDFTVFGPLLFIFGFVFTTAGILMACFGYHPGLLWSVLGVILFSFYLLFDTQMIMGGDKKRYQFDEDSYILAAVTLYLDIINIFLYILEILNDK